jgi:hypothetical protein
MPELHERTATAVPQPHRKCLSAAILLVAAVTSTTATMSGRAQLQVPLLAAPGTLERR